MWILDGAMGTQLAERGIPTPAPGWSVHALETAPEDVVAIHRAYAQAGAQIHRANTFRVQRRITDRYRVLAQRAYELARRGIGNAPLFGSMAPIEDCYRPDLSPPGDVARTEHRATAESLVEAGFDRLLCETFPHAGEAAIAVEEAARTGLETWVALTAGPQGDLMTPEAMESAARACIAAGATAVLVDCVAATKTLPYVKRLARIGAPFGAYANAGSREEELGWGASDELRAGEAYADLAATWIAEGATIVGSCCGTGPAHIRELARRFSR